MEGGRFRVVRGRGRRSARYDGDSAAGIGEALRIENAIADEGDERMRALIEKLKEIESRPDAPDPSSD